MGNICRVVIILDKDVPEYMNGIIRCGSVISEDEKGDETDHDDLINNDEFQTEEELIENIAARLEVSTDIVEIEN